MYKRQNLLISEPTNCPYCATSDFGITYEPPSNRRVGLQAIAPSLFVDTNNHITPEADAGSQPPTRRASLAATDHRVVSSDSLRPDWQIKLNKERMRLARRSANATAIHVSNQLIAPGHSASANLTSTSAPQTNEGAYAMHAHSAPLWPSNATAAEIENQMVEQAIKLSLADQNREKAPGRE